MINVHLFYYDDNDNLEKEDIEIVRYLDGREMTVKPEIKNLKSGITYDELASYVRDIAIKEIDIWRRVSVVFGGTPRVFAMTGVSLQKFDNVDDAFHIEFSKFSKMVCDSLLDIANLDKSSFAFMRAGQRVLEDRYKTEKFSSDEAKNIKDSALFALETLINNAESSFDEMLE